MKKKNVKNKKELNLSKSWMKNKERKINNFKKEESQLGKTKILKKKMIIQKDTLKKKPNQIKSKAKELVTMIKKNKNEVKQMMIVETGVISRMMKNK